MEAPLDPAEALAALVRPGGVLVIGTLNRTPLSFVKAIVGAEYVLGWLPKGTHDWRRFVKPANRCAARQGSLPARSRRHQNVCLSLLVGEYAGCSAIVVV